MKHFKSAAFLAGLAALSCLAPGVARAQDNAAAHEGHANHAMAATASNKEVQVKAIIHKADADNGMLNVTHDPIPALKWPTMTMDLPVTRRVDLSAIQAGMKAMITLKQGRDKQYRIIAIKPAE